MRGARSTDATDGRRVTPDGRCANARQRRRTPAGRLARRAPCVARRHESCFPHPNGGRYALTSHHPHAPHIVAA
jgi:hypothetical protein